MLLLDTNILIGYLADDPVVIRFIDAARAKDQSLGISVITEIELFSSPALDEGEELIIERLLETIQIISLHSVIGGETARLRRQLRLSLGDAAIAATAKFQHATLVTRDKTLAKRLIQINFSVQIV